MSQQPSPPAIERIEAEERALSEVISSLEDQQRRHRHKFTQEQSRARELTSNLVATRREEDKALLASDEAVSHGLKDKIETELEHLGKLINKPYFARLIVEEDGPHGPRSIEYKMGLIENADCRIVDWRKAPIARLYYEYREGDEYCEQILDRERNGRVALRNVVSIEKQQLTSMSCSLGRFEKHGNQWVALSDPQRSRPSTEQSPSSYGLPQIASLLTPDQFTLVAETADSAMLIQGIAGSGKTTVALHRLAWLIGRTPDQKPHEINNSSKEMVSPITSEKCLMVVLSQSLKRYLAETLPALGVEGVRILTFEEWAAENIAAALPNFVVRENDSWRVKRPDATSPHSIERLKRSMAVLKTLESSFQSLGDSPLEALANLLKLSNQIIQHDESKLIDASLIRDAAARTSDNLKADVLDRADDALILRFLQLKNNSVVMKDGSFELYDHIVADEVQDFGPTDLACVIASVRDPRGVTLVGDTAQKIDPSSTFPGWDTLRKHWAFRDSMPHFVSLNLSHRSTEQIVRLADFIQSGTSPVPTKGKSESHPHGSLRQGRVPIWFMATTETLAIESALNWLNRACEKYPHGLTAVVCRSSSDAAQVYKLLTPTFGPQVQRGVSNVFSSPCGIVVTWMEEVRGLEFTSVLLWNPCKRDYPQDDLHRNLLYTAITRAEENLCIVTWLKPSVLLPPFHSPLVRGHRIEPEELQQA